MSMKEASKKKRLWLDLALILALLILAAVLYFQLSGGEEAGASVVVIINGEETARYPLSKNGTHVLNGGTNTLVIENGYAWMSEAECPDQICVHMGKIHLNGQLVVCLPNGVIVTVEGGEDSGVDIFG